MPTTIAISSFQIPDLNFAGSTFKLRRYYDSDWQDVDGVLHLAGTPGSATDSFDEIDCTLVSHTGTVPSFNATPTLTALINQNVRETWQLWDEAGSARNIIAENWFIPASPATITRGALEIENRGQSLLWPPSWYLSALQVQQLIDAQIGLLNHASSVIEGRTFLDVDPLVAITPEAVGSNSPVIPGFVLHTSKYASLNLAITAITALGGGTIVVDSSTALTGNGATTASIALEFRGQGQVTGAFSLTIVGPMEAPAGQRFSSSTTVLWTGNTVQKNHSLSWYGVTATVASDQSAAYQRAATATLSGMVLLLDVFGNVRLDSTVTFLDLRNICVVNLQVVGRSDLNQPTHQLIWYGANGGTVLRVDRVRDSYFHGIGTWGSATGAADGADTNLFLTQDGSGVNISSNNVFEHCYFSAGNTRAGWIGAKIENTSGSNNEQHEFTHCGFVGGNQAYPNQTGTGIYLGHSNVKHVIIRRCQRIGLAKWVDTDNGSFRSEYCFGSNCGIAYTGGISDAVSIIGEESEQDTQILSLTGSGVTPIHVIGGRFADLHGGQAVTGTTTDSPVFEIVNSASLVIESTMVAALANAPFTADLITNPSGSESVLWLQNSVSGTPQHIIDAALNSFAYGFASDKFGSRWVGRRNIVANVMTRPTSRSLIQSIPSDPAELAGYIPAAVDSLILGTGELEVKGLARPNKLFTTIVGTAGAVSYLLAVLARDSLGNRTLISTLNQDVTTANATLTGSNYIQLDWPAVPNATDYIVLQWNGAAWRIIDTVTASGTDYETYNIVANPASAYTYVAPTYNETATLNLRGATTLSSASPIAFTPTSPAELVANTNNWNPGGTAPYASSIVRFSTDVSRNITGLTFTKTQTSGQVHLLINVGLADAVLVHQSGLSTAAHRFYNFSAANITLAPKQAALVEYDATNAY